MRMIRVVYGFVSTIAFVSCVAGQEPVTSDTETAVSVDGIEQVCPDLRDCPSPGRLTREALLDAKPQACTNPKECPQPGSLTREVPRDAKAQVCLDPRECPSPGTPTEGTWLDAKAQACTDPKNCPQPGMHAAARGAVPAADTAATAIQLNDCPLSIPQCHPPGLAAEAPASASLAPALAGKG